MLLRNIQKLAFGRANIRNIRFHSTGSRQGHQAHEEAEDFRPPWVYVGSRLMTFTIIPSIVIYSVFFYDFGDRDHVFQPIRRWGLQQKAAFLTLSPDEERIFKANKTNPESCLLQAPSPAEAYGTLLINLTEESIKTVVGRGPL